MGKWDQYVVTEDAPATDKWSKYEVAPNKDAQSPGNPSTNPSLQGGAKSPANVQAQSDLKDAQDLNNKLDPAVGAVGAAYNATWPVSMLAKKAIGQGSTPVPQATTSGGKMLQDMGVMANPLLGEAAGLVGKGLSKIGTVIPDALKYAKPAEESALAKTVRTAAYQAKTDTVNTFGDGVDTLAKANPGKTVSLRGVVDNITQNMEDMAPEAKNILRRTPILKDLLNDPQLADEVSLGDTQKIINYINTKVPRTIKANHLDILDTLNDTRAAQLDAFPEMADVRAKYGDFINAFNSVKGKLKQGSLIENMAKDFGDAEMKQNVSKVLNQSTLDEVKKFQQARQVLKTAGVMGNWALKGAATTAVGAGAYEGYRKLSGK